MVWLYDGFPWLDRIMTCGLREVMGRVDLVIIRDVNHLANGEKMLTPERAVTGTRVLA